MADAPVLFISYRWSSPEHSDWVLELATNLRSDGIDVKIDRWDLRPGHDALKFMEDMVTDPHVTKVLVVSDRGYADRANAREGGVGVEAQIISRKVYESTTQEKFAAILLELDEDGRPVLPTFLANRIYFDFTTDEAKARNYEEIVRWVFDKPLDVRPPIGHAPTFLDRDAQNTIPVFKGLAFSTSKKSDGDAIQYLQTVSSNSRAFIISLSGNDDPLDAAYEAILDTTNTRDEVYLAFRDLFRVDEKKAFKAAHDFFERFLADWDYSPLNETYTRLDNDALRYFIHDCFVGFVAIALAEEKFEGLSEFLATPFYILKHDGRTGDTNNYAMIRPYLESMEHRNRQKNLNRLSLHADIIAETHKTSVVPLDQFLQADLVLYVRSLLNTSFPWYPISAIWLAGSYGSVKVFARGESTRYFSRLASLFFGLGPEPFRTKIREQIADPNGVFRFDYRALPLESLLNLEKLGTI